MSIPCKHICIRCLNLCKRPIERNWRSFYDEVTCDICKKSSNDVYIFTKEEYDLISKEIKLTII